MADSAVERPAVLSTTWLRLLAPNPERLEFSTRLALICALTALVAEIYQTPDPALTVYIAFFLNQPERTVSLILSVAFVIVITVAIALIFPVANWVANDAMWRVISIAVISFGFLFLTSASRLRPVGSTVALIIAYALDLLGNIQAGELATRALLYAWLFVAIPAGVSVLVNLLLAPAPRRGAEQAIAERLKLSASVLRDPTSVTRGELTARVREGMAPILAQLRLAGLEKSAPVRDLASLKQAALSCFALMSAVDALAASPEVELPDAVRGEVANAVDEIAQCVQLGLPPRAVALRLPEEPSSSPLARELLAAIRDAVTRFAEPDTTPQASPKKKGGFLAVDAFSNPEHVHYALKTTAAALFCYVLYELLDWSGIHTSFLTCYIVAQSTAAESVEKLTLRILGCLVGAAAGIAAIVFLLPSITSIGGLMITVFVGCWAGAYVAAGGPRIGYAGLQMAFAFLLCIIQGSGPAFDLTTARDRIIGILLGNIVAYLAIVHVWPVTISRRVDPALAAAFRQLVKVVAAKAPPERRLLASQVQGSLKEIETDIALAGYEPASIRSSLAWLSSRRQVVEDTQSLGTLLLLSSDQRELSRVEAATRLERLAARLAGSSDRGADTPAGAMEPMHGWQTLPARINQRLRGLEETLPQGVGSLEGSPDAPS
jgi:multidrug resistance protein MdtO